MGQRAACSRPRARGGHRCRDETPQPVSVVRARRSLGPLLATSAFDARMSLAVSLAVFGPVGEACSVSCCIARTILADTGLIAAPRARVPTCHLQQQVHARIGEAYVSRRPAEVVYYALGPRGLEGTSVHAQATASVEHSTFKRRDPASGQDEQPKGAPAASRGAGLAFAPHGWTCCFAAEAQRPVRTLPFDQRPGPGSRHRGPCLFLAAGVTWQRSSRQPTSSATPTRVRGSQSLHRGAHAGVPVSRRRWARVRDR